MKKTIIIGLIGVGLVWTAVAFSAPVFFRFEGTNTVLKAYQTAEEFFADGGAQDFSNVQVIPNVQEPTLGSVTVGNEYNSTTTTYMASTTPLLKTGGGVLGSVIITGSASGFINIYDATTTNINLRKSTMATSSILLASFAASPTVGTYTFDTTFKWGLYLDLKNIIGSTTITWR